MRFTKFALGSQSCGKLLPKMEDSVTAVCSVQCTVCLACLIDLWLILADVANVSYGEKQSSSQAQHANQLEFVVANRQSSANWHP